MDKKKYGLEALVKGFEEAGVTFNQEIINKFHQEREASDKQEVESLIASLEAKNKEREIDRFLDERNEQGFRLVSR